MARIINFVKTVRNHWKKSTFALLAGSYGVYYLNNKYNENLIRREFCKLAVEYGQESVGPHPVAKARKVTVFLNPAAKNGKAKKLFDKNAAPILHLAGLNVEIIQSTHEGHVKDQVASLASTDAVVVVGGDGSLAEAITGLLRRPDGAAVSGWPIGIIPTGVTNTLARVLHTDSTEEVRWMCNAAIAIVKGLTVPIDVIAIKDSDGRTTYALNHLKWSAFEDAKDKITKYWYFGPLKSRVALIFYTLSKNWYPALGAQVTFTGPKDIPVPPAPPLLPSIWTRMYWRVFGKPQEESDEVDIEEEIERTEKDIRTTELLVTTNQLQETDEDLGILKFIAFSTHPCSTLPTAAPEKDYSCTRARPEGKKSLCLDTVPHGIDRTSFIKEGWRRINSQDQESTELSYQSEHVGDLDLLPEIAKDETSWYTIDSERFEAGPVTITLMPNKLRFFSQSQPTTSQSEPLNSGVK